MSKTETVTVDVRIPTGYKYLRYDYPDKGELYLEDGVVTEAPFTFINSKEFIVEKSYVFKLSDPAIVNVTITPLNNICIELDSENNLHWIELTKDDVIQLAKYFKLIK